MCQLYEITVKGITNVFAFVVSFFVLQKEVAVSNVNLRQPLFIRAQALFIISSLKIPCDIAVCKDRNIYLFVKEDRYAFLARLSDRDQA